MDLNAYTVAIARGDGLVARTGGVVMYVAETTNAAALLSALDSIAAAPSPGWTLAKVLATIDSESIPPFGVVAPAGDGLQVMLRGPVTADIEADGASRTVAGDRALTWLDEMVRGAVAKIVVGGGDVAGLSADPLTGLLAGVVPGGGFVLTPAAAAQPPAPAPAVVEQVASGTRDESGEPDQVPKPVDDRQTSTTSGSVPTEVLSQPPGWSGEAPGASPWRPAEARPRRRVGPTAMPAPFTGALTADDQAVYPLDRPYVIGRDPLVDNAVREAKASPIVLAGDPQISRVHAYVTINGDVVLVRDARTTGGTYVAAPGDQTWTRVGDQPIELKPGWCLRIGARILTYRNANAGQ